MQVCLSGNCIAIMNALQLLFAIVKSKSAVVCYDHIRDAI